MNDFGSGLRFEFDSDPSRDIRTALGRKIDEFHSRTVPLAQERFALLLRDDADRLAGGLSGALYWDWLFVDELWIDDAWRGKGLGRELLTRAERHAVDRGCHSVWLDTFQARGFYERLGYEVFGALDNYPSGQQRSFLKKSLIA